MSESFYREYRRLEWRIKKEDQRYRRNCTPFSALTGAVENFSEFADHSSDPSKEMFKRQLYADLRKALKQLKQDELDLVVALFFENRSERDYSVIINLPRKTINNRRHSILCKLHKLLRSS